MFLLLTVATMLAVSQAATAASNFMPHAARHQQEVPAIERWITSPNIITLSKGQRARFDSLKTQYVDERQSVIDARKTTGEMSMVMRLRDLDGQYARAVRDLLDAGQREVFDKNLLAAHIQPPSPDER
jgi:Spy/CpxP family protein refolding chaperone